MKTKEFHMILPSNASPETQPSNTAGDFIVNWENPIDLDPQSEWYVALTELSYIYSPSTISTNYGIKYKMHEQGQLQARIQLSYHFDLRKFTIIEEQYLTTAGNDVIHYDTYDFGKGVMQIIQGEKNFERKRGLRFSITKDNCMYVECSDPFQLTLPNDAQTLLGFAGSINSIERNKSGKWFIKSHDNRLLSIQRLRKDNTMESIVMNNIVVTVYEYWTIPHVFHFHSNKTFQKSEEFVAYLKEHLIAVFNDIFIDENGKIRFVLQPHVSELHLLNGLNYVLGFRRSDFFIPDMELRYLSAVQFHREIAEATPQLKRGIINMYVYASICEPIYVGHTMVPLLKNVFIDSSQDANENGYARNYVVYNPMYIPVSSTSFNSIEINIRNDGGQVVPFPEGSVTSLTLHFKKI